MGVIVLMLMGCKSSTLPLSRLPDVPPSLALECAPLRELAAGDGKTVLFWMVETATQYQDCAARHGALVQWLNDEKGRE